MKQSIPPEQLVTLTSKETGEEIRLIPPYYISDLKGKIEEYAKKAYKRENKRRKHLTTDAIVRIMLHFGWTLFIPEEYEFEVEHFILNRSDPIETD